MLDSTEVFKAIIFTFILYAFILVFIYSVSQKKTRTATINLT